MTNPERLTQLRQMLASHLIRERQAGIKMAAEMLVKDLQRDEVRAQLENLSQNDPINMVKDEARKVLAADNARLNPALAAPPDYVFGAKCQHCHHITYFDKRKVCPNQGNVTRGVIRRDGQELDNIQVTCEHCSKDFMTLVPCKGYK